MLKWSSSSFWSILWCWCGCCQTCRWLHLLCWTTEPSHVSPDYRKWFRPLHSLLTPVWTLCAPHAASAPAPDQTIHTHLYADVTASGSNRHLRPATVTQSYFKPENITNITNHCRIILYYSVYQSSALSWLSGSHKALLWLAAMNKHVALQSRAHHLFLHYAVTGATVLYPVLDAVNYHLD